MKNHIRRKHKIEDLEAAHIDPIVLNKVRKPVEKKEDLLEIAQRQQINVNLMALGHLSAITKEAILTMRRKLPILDSLILANAMESMIKEPLENDI